MSSSDKESGIAAASTPDRQMKWRVLTAIVGISLTAIAVLSPTPLILFALLLFGLGAGLRELGRLLDWSTGGYIAASILGLIGMFAPFGIAALGDFTADVPFAASIILTLAGAAAVSSKKLTLNWIAALWLAAPLGILLTMHSWAAHPSPLWLILVPIWSGDTAALFVGKSIGQHKIAPTISPKKTWEGSIAHLAASILVAGLLAGYYGIPALAGGLLGAMLSVLGQSGDLFESWIKRQKDVKDSGTVLPGHGGILDRLDSLLSSAGAAALMIAAVQPVLFHVKQFSAFLPS
jgi:phosphatidate cytidylyltransferase